MKVTVTIELDLSDTPLDIRAVSDIRYGLQELSSIFQDLHTAQLTKISNIMCSHLDPKSQEFAIQQREQIVKITAQLFNNYRVQGTTTDGHTFDFLHQDPGYKERMLIDGLEKQDY